MRSTLSGALATAILAGAGAAAAPPGVSAPNEPGYLLTASETSVDQLLIGEVGGVWSADTTPSGHDIALVLGPTGIPTPSDEYLQTAYNLYLHPSGLYTGPENDVYALTTPEVAENTETGLAADEGDINGAVLPLLEHGNHVTLFGYSQSAAAISQWLDSLHGQYADQIDFVLVGDSASPNGMLANLYDSLPAWAQGILLDNAEAWGLSGGVMNLGPGHPSATGITPDGPYRGDVFTLSSGGSDNPDPDGFASWNPDSFADGSNLWWLELMGLFSTHEEYLGVTPDDVTQALSQLDPDSPVNYLDLDPGQSELELLTQAAAGVGWLSQSFADSLLALGL